MVWVWEGGGGGVCVGGGGVMGGGEVGDRGMIEVWWVGRVA